MDMMDIKDLKETNKFKSEDLTKNALEKFDNKSIAHEIIKTKYGEIIIAKKENNVTLRVFAEILAEIKSKYMDVDNVYGCIIEKDNEKEFKTVIFRVDNQSDVKTITNDYKNQKSIKEKGFIIYSQDSKKNPELDELIKKAFNGTLEDFKALCNLLPTYINIDKICIKDIKRNRYNNKDYKLEDMEIVQALKNNYPIVVKAPMAESIDLFAKLMVEKKNTLFSELGNIYTDFNGYLLRVSNNSTPDSVKKDYYVQSEVSSYLYRRSECGKNRKARFAKLIEDQREKEEKEFNELKTNFNKLEFKNIDMLVPWIASYSYYASRDKEFTEKVINEFELNGYAANENVERETFKHDDKEYGARYIIGQCLDGFKGIENKLGGLSEGVHPSIHYSVHEWTRKFIKKGTK